MNQYQVTLRTAYYYQNYFNVGVAASNHLGNHNEPLQIILPNGQIIHSTINRTIINVNNKSPFKSSLPMKVSFLIFNKENSQSSGNSTDNGNSGGQRLVPSSPSTDDYLEKGEKTVPIKKKGGWSHTVYIRDLWLGVDWFYTRLGVEEMFDWV